MKGKQSRSSSARRARDESAEVAALRAEVADVRAEARRNERAVIQLEQTTAELERQRALNADGTSDELERLRADTIATLERERVRIGRAIELLSLGLDHKAGSFALAEKEWAELVGLLGGNVCEPLFGDLSTRTLRRNMRSAKAVRQVMHDVGVAEGRLP